MVSAEELGRVVGGEYRCELVEGRIVRMTPVGFQHARIVGHLCELLRRHAEPRRLGFVLPELGVRLAANPDTVRAPDVAFIRRERIPGPPPSGFWNGAPDLAIEVLSPDDRKPDVQGKVDEYLSAGATLVVVIDPELLSATSSRHGQAPVVVGSHDELDLSDVVDGLRIPTSGLFE
jgi:Uma2 family endonuclease